jgi:hypothetical protein
MKTYIITLLSLSLLAGGTLNLNAQTTASTNSVNADAWYALKIAQGENFTPTSPEAVAIKDAILAQERITKAEASIIRAVLASSAGGSTQLKHWPAEAIAVVRENASKSPQFAAIAKYWDRDPTGWTPEMIEDGLSWTYSLALLPAAPAEFKAQIWERAKNAKGDNATANKFFKAYRATLPKAEQIAATAQQKALLVAVPSRSPAQNAWLAEISADLIALSLDQQQ